MVWQILSALIIYDVIKGLLQLVTEIIKLDGYFEGRKDEEEWKSKK